MVVYNPQGFPQGKPGRNGSEMVENGNTDRRMKGAKHCGAMDRWAKMGLPDLERNFASKPRQKIGEYTDSTPSKNRSDRRKTGLKRKLKSGYPTGERIAGEMSKCTKTDAKMHQRF